MSECFVRTDHTLRTSQNYPTDLKKSKIKNVNTFSRLHTLTTPQNYPTDFPIPVH